MRNLWMTPGLVWRPLARPMWRNITFAIARPVVPTPQPVYSPALLQTGLPNQVQTNWQMWTGFDTGMSVTINWTATDTDGISLVVEQDGEVSTSTTLAYGTAITTIQPNRQVRFVATFEPSDPFAQPSSSVDIDIWSNVVSTTSLVRISPKIFFVVTSQ